MTALHSAASNDLTEVVHIFFEFGCKKNLQDIVSISQAGWLVVSLLKKQHVLWSHCVLFEILLLETHQALTFSNI